MRPHVAINNRERKSGISSHLEFANYLETLNKGPQNKQLKCAVNRRRDDWAKRMSFYVSVELYFN